MAGGHRSILKQKNKSHNHGKHRSKRNLKREAHGKVNVKQITKDKKIKEVLRQEAAVKRVDGRGNTLDEKRGVATLPPRLVVVVSLEKSVNTTAVVDLLKEADLTAITNKSEQNVLHVSACKLKNRMCFITPEYGNLQELLDAAKAADVVLFVVGEDGMDKYGEHCLACVMGQGIPASVFACQGLSKLSKKKTSDAKKLIDKQIEKSFPDCKFRTIDTWQDAQALWRQVANLALKPLHFRDSRPYLLAEKLEFEQNVENDADATEEINDAVFGTLKLSGYLRGKSLNVNKLVHLPGWGDFQMSQIDQSDDPYPLVVKGNKDRRKKEDGTDDEMKEVTPRSFCLAKATNPESLQSEVIPDEMDQEQTWPTAEELGEDKPVKVKSLKGVSDYQRNWILDLEDGSAGSDDSEDETMEDEMMADAKKPEGSDEELEEEDEGGLDAATATEVDENENYDDQIDLDEDKKMYERMKEERLHVHFPDEIDTPIDVPARTRFARYRGMDSFQTTVWDHNDSLPYDYARIYRVNKHHYKRLKKISVVDQEDDATDNLLAEPGNYITVHVKNVPKSFMDFHKPGNPVTLFGLFSNEQKMTLISALISRAPGFKSPVKAKDPLVFQIGFRRFSSCPIFSEHSYQNKFKMERFLPQQGFIVASMFAPIMFAPAPVLVFRENVMQKYDLVAKGSLMPLDTDRIVIKRVVLSGAPFKINKRSVVVRYMFFNREDIEFYKPIELRTKYGKRGHIKQALGTHGHMKCTFNGQLKSEDTVLMNLYKRVYPKWSYDPCVNILPPVMEDGSVEESDEEMEKEPEKGEAFKLFD
ncbi:pre-rRNA-processing protein TSR1 homolog [Physella acuta]|uniref:pre-rRNA-processing protein TSR1 homolog n=1 Tax=Physella acuta TaxID=109671 RepID=UPI0027DC8C66|nr:pre-rRNA-processing protein TSR1 homolog [Physella acuta]